MRMKSSLVLMFAVIASASAIAQTAPTPLPPAAATPAPAATTAIPDAVRAKFRSACAADVQKFCATAPKGKGMTRACLDSHVADLSDACKTARADRAALKK